MKYTHAMLVGVCFLVVSGAINAPRADDRDKENHGVTLYTTRFRADHFICVAVNVSEKTLSISFAVNDVNGNALLRQPHHLLRHIEKLNDKPDP